MREFDLLERPIETDAGIERAGSTYRVRSAWAMARFGDVGLETGWWKLDCLTSDDASALEVRISSPQNPLIIFEGKRAQDVRIFLRGDRSYNISLLISAWPGEMTFERLRLRRLTLRDKARLYLAGASRLLRKRNPVAALAGFLARAMEGESLWIQTAKAVAPTPGHTSAGVDAKADSAPPRIERSGDVVAVLGASDRLHPRAFEIVVEEFACRPWLQAVYSDVDEDGLIVPRPAWDAELANHFDVAAPPIFLRSEACSVANDLARFGADFVERHGARALGRISLPLVSRPRAVHPEAAILPKPDLEQVPRITAIIPTKTRIDLLEKCLEGLAHRTSYSNLEVIVVDNGSSDPRLPGLLERMSKILDLVDVHDPRDFNFSRLINVGAARATGEVLLLLNDDVEPIAEGWLHRMVASVMRPDVGAVGARLTYPDGSIQHAGVTLGIGGVCGHLWKGMSASDATRNPYVAYPGERMAVTGACLAVRREVFESVHGLDEEGFAVAYNDIDFCLRVRGAGYRNIYRGDVVLVHHESQSRGLDITAAQRRRLAQETASFLARWRHLIGNDTFYSPEFDPSTETGAIHLAAWRDPKSTPRSKA